MKKERKKLKAMNYRYSLIALALLTVSPIIAGQMISDSKTLRKSFRVGSDAILDVNNKYGDIHISHSYSDSITVRAEVTASSNTGGKLDAMMSDVDVSMTMAGGTVRVQTTFTKGITPLFESLKGLTKNLINFDSRLKIDYFIECPPLTELMVTNSYGDVYIGDETPALTLKLSNGALDAAAVRHARLLELTFCKANIRSIDSGIIKLSFSELRTKEAGKISLASTSSKIWIDNCGSLDLDAKRDNLNVGFAEVITGTSYFSDIIADMVAKEINMSVKYGNLSFGNIARGFSLIDLRSTYADIDMAVEENAGYSLEIRHTNAFVSLPGFEPRPEPAEISAQNKIYLTKATVGSRPGSSQIRIDATRGEIRVLQK
jgi:hypothetical protein